MTDEETVPECKVCNDTGFVRIPNGMYTHQRCDCKIGNSPTKKLVSVEEIADILQNEIARFEIYYENRDENSKFIRTDYEWKSILGVDFNGKWDNVKAYIDGMKRARELIGLHIR